MKKRKCPICKKIFKPKHPNTKYCSPKCKIKARKRQLQKSNDKRRETDQHRDYMMRYMWEYRHHKYRNSALNTNTIAKGTDTPPIDYNIYHDSKLMFNSIR